MSTYHDPRIDRSDPEQAAAEDRHNAAPGHVQMIPMEEYYKLVHKAKLWDEVVEASDKSHMTTLGLGGVVRYIIGRERAEQEMPSDG